MSLVALGWELPPGFTHPMNRILVSVFKVPREPANDIARLLDRLDEEGPGKRVA